MMYRTAGHIAQYADDVNVSRTFSPWQIGFAALVVTAFSLLTYFGKVSGDATIALVSGITGAVLAAPLGARAAHEEGRSTGMREGVEAANAAGNGNGHGVSVAQAPAVVTAPAPGAHG